MIPARALIRDVAYRSGALALVRKRLRGALTVAMFHRVIDRADPEFATSDPAYTITTDLFDDLLGFFEDHYIVVNLTDIMGASDPTGVSRLPEHPLLITFDDGWADNLRYAAPRLKSRQMPAVVFAAAEAVSSTELSWWHEQIFAAVRGGSLRDALSQSPIGRTLLAPDGTDKIDPLDIIVRLAALDEPERSMVLAPIASDRTSRMMLSPVDLPKLIASGFAIATHGYTHLPLTRVEEIDTELRAARKIIESLTGDAMSATALACPHGRYDQRVIRAARAAGMQLIFTSDPVLNLTANGRLLSGHPIGRISIGSHLADPSGRLDRAAAATWLWRRNVEAAV